MITSKVVGVFIALRFIEERPGVSLSLIAPGTISAFIGEAESNSGRWDVIVKYQFSTIFHAWQWIKFGLKFKSNNHIAHLFGEKRNCADRRSVYSIIGSRSISYRFSSNLSERTPPLAKGVEVEARVDKAWTGGKSLVYFPSTQEHSMYHEGINILLCPYYHPLDLYNLYRETIPFFNLKRSLSSDHFKTFFNSSKYFFFNSNLRNQFSFFRI